MDLRILVCAMCIILFSLSIFVKIYRPKEKLQMKLEASYVEGLKKYLSTPNQTLRAQIVDYGLNYYNNLGLTEENSLKMIEKDLKQKSL